jgi:mannose-6-phosphate isomerase-like protein (cupin superfamily)
MRKVNKPWGYELIWAETPKYLGKLLRIMAGKRLSLQYHAMKDETIFVQKGTMLFELGQTKDQLTKFTLEEGETHHIPSGYVHRMSAITDVEVIEVSTPEIDDVIRIADDYNRVK